MYPIRLCASISGSGTTMEAIFKSTIAQKLKNVELACVISSDPFARGKAKAEAFQIPTKVIHRKMFTSTEAFGEGIIRFCRKHDVNFFGQYGWLPLTPKNVIEYFEGERIVNQHPGIVRPGGLDFGGKGMHGVRVHAARLRFIEAISQEDYPLRREEFWTELTTQLVHEKCDQGRPVMISQLPMHPGEDPQVFNDFALKLEWELQISALRQYATFGRWPILSLPEVVRPSERALLEECKAWALEKYPE
jgi:folate-dependent phosphoribosylglycinamide formyltransferase PurN